MTYTLGIDVGTFETKGSLVDHSGNLLGQAKRAHKMLVPKAGWAEHRPEEDWWGDFCFVSNAILNQTGINPNAIKAVSCSAIGPCMLPVNSEGKPLRNGILYGVDNRAETEIKELNAKIGEEEILKRCGNALTSQAVGPKILWFRRNYPDLFKKTHKILTSTSFLVHRLTNEYVIDHYTAANFSPLYDVSKQNWTQDLANDIIDTARLPTLKWSGEIVGSVSASAATSTGLAEGTAVTTGTIDAAAEAFSVGVTNPGDMMLMYGSTIFIILRTEQRSRDSRLWYAPWLFEGEHAAMAGLATSGTLTHWFRDQFAKELEPANAIPTLVTESKNSPKGAKGLILLPYFSGERTPIHNSQAKGVFFGLNLTHHRGDLFRALIEGIAYGTRHVTDTFRDLGQTPSKVFAVGGGTKNMLWLQATSDITGVNQYVRDKTIGASYGDAFLAALSINAVERSDIEKWNPIKRTVKHKAHPNYESNYKIFRQLYESTKDLMREI
ncbi:MAG: FGGY-family carbohydrate kinase [Pseudomonadota bacterium]|nr:FGGY-family carbohydrate kinase [Pseudomonadota bacterium]